MTKLRKNLIIRISDNQLKHILNEKIDNLKPEELAEYIRNVLSETGPYGIESCDIFQLKHTPTLSAIEKVNKVLAEFQFNDEDEYLIAFRATNNHIRNMMLNMARKIEDKTAEFNQVYTEIKKDTEN
jgi:hypothetical protein